MKYCIISDTHGKLINNIPECDILLIAGDIVPLYCQRQLDISMDWLKAKFVPWCLKQPCEKVVFIGGNHDFVLEKMPEAVKFFLDDEKNNPLHKVIYLNCEIFEYKGKKIYGYPYCSIFYNWAFMLPEETEWKIVQDSNLPEKIDILLTHDAPYGINDVLEYTTQHIGNPVITKIIQQYKPDYNFHGHLHSTLHAFEDYEHEDKTTTKVICASILDENYHRGYKPLFIEI